MSFNRKIEIIDTTMRDGDHAVSHCFSPEDAARLAEGLDRAGVSFLEVGHGDGLAGSSIQYGFSRHPEEHLHRAVVRVLKRSKLCVLLLPGIGTIEELRAAHEIGAGAARIATHCTEADISEQHIDLAKKLGMTSIGALMMVHMIPPQDLAVQAKLMESYGADIIYYMDSAGALLPQQVRERLQAAKDVLKVPIGFHAHNNLSLAVANELAAVEAGAEYLDGCLRGLGAGSGNAQIEVLAAVLEKAGIETGVDLYTLMDTAEQVLVPLMKRPQVIDNASLILGYAGVYSSFLLHTFRAAEKFNVDFRDVLVELGRRKTVGGQEDWIIEVCAEMAGLARSRTHP
ncbi:MAG: 4-hydroxy-2-oxovalerate aldolase [Thermodesulfobacteriota bacterium]